MEVFKVLFFTFLFYGNTILCIEEDDKHIVHGILMLVEHYKQDNPVGFPEPLIGEYIPLPNVPLVNGELDQIVAYNYNSFHIRYIELELSQMKVKGAVIFDSISIKGMCKTKFLFSKSNTLFTGVFTNLSIDATINLHINKDGDLKTNNIIMDSSFGNIHVNFVNGSIQLSIFKGLINTMGTTIFKHLKPKVFKMADENIRTLIDETLKKTEMHFSNSIPPLDLIIAETCRKIRNMNLDPFEIKDYKYFNKIFQINFNKSWLKGFSSFHRIGNITLAVKNKTVYADCSIGMLKLEGFTEWKISAMRDYLKLFGTASFSIDYINVHAIISQSLDTRNRPQLRHLNLEVGNIQVRSEGLQTIDYILESAINILPNLLRNHIFKGLETPLSKIIQEIFNEINVEELIKEKVSQFVVGGVQSVRIKSWEDFNFPPKEIFIKEKIFDLENVLDIDNFLD